MGRGPHRIWEWSAARDASATLDVRLFLPWSEPTVSAVELEGRGLPAFTAPEAEHDVRIISSGGR